MTQVCKTNSIKDLTVPGAIIFGSELRISWQEFREKFCVAGLLLAFAGPLLGGCASADKPLAKVELPADLPQDLRTKFEVKDTPDPSVTPSPSPSASPDASAIKDTAALKEAERIAHLSAQEKRRLVRKKAREAREAKLAKSKSVGEIAVAVPNRRAAKDPIWVGEKFMFEITYFGMSAGDFTIEVAPFKMIANRKVYDIQGKAESSSVFSMFYTLNDSIESFVDYEGIFSHRFHLILNETKQTRDAMELYDYDKLQTFYWNKWNHRERGYTESKEYGQIQPWSQDSVSALYYLRTLPLPTGAVYSIPVVSEGKPWEAVVTVIRREVVDSPLGRVKAIVLKPQTKFRGKLQERGDSFIWVTDDDRRIPLRLEAKVKIGTVVATLKQVVSLGNAPAPEPSPALSTPASP